jgi:hypothetical protein
MTHLETRCPAHIEVEVAPAYALGFTATATDILTGAQASAWGPTDTDARQRAEYLLNLGAA